MEGQKRPQGADLTRLEPLVQTPQAYHIFQALRLIEAAHPQSPKLGQSRRPSEDPVRLTQAADLAFPPATITGFAPQDQDGPGQLSQQMFGLFGPSGALPLHLTEYARDRQRNHNDATFVAFADMFHHRMLSLLYRAWASGQPAASFDRPGEDGFGQMISAFAGVAGEAFEDRDAMPDVAKRHYAGLLAAAPRSESGLSAILSGMTGAEVQIDSFVGSWLHLEPHDRGQLGAVTLGQNANLGERFWSRASKFRVRIGPMSLADYKSLLPGTKGYKRLAAIIRNYAGDTLEWEANLILLSSEVPPAILGQAATLGRTAWIGQRPPGNADDLCLSPPLSPVM
ncbi:type VI secretion system baseplate subunit TssG [Thalassobius sp. S69A]|uniref:type VI secretion system baseplate subunit TssG n=1 Tax=unclassified Thalassovita TaxID=2619711 RepID=UPI000C0DD2A3|nr:type VI secretion system baseplate subunit TssG [Paracoccaceae bacterium]MBT25705.1 type VI secretion system baseplate subunit TssG [Paracoccaceae bacterium]